MYAQMVLKNGRNEKGKGGKKKKKMGREKKEF